MFFFLFEELGVFGGVRLVFKCSLLLRYSCLVFLGFQELVARVETSLEGTLRPQRQRRRVYSPRNRLRRDMIGDNPIYQLFVSGSSTGSDKLFFCKICHRDVSMESRGASEFARHFFGKRHWQLDVTYRVQHDLPIFNRLMDPMELSDAQVSDYMSRPSKGLAEGFSFPEDLLPACTRVDSSVPLMTMINSVLELFRCGGSYTLLRKLWGSFRATLGPEEPLFSLKWDRAETLVRCLIFCNIRYSLFVFERVVL